MRCRNCGTEILETDKFCLKCGCPNNVIEDTAVVTAEVGYDNYPQTEAEEQPKKKKGKGKIIAILVMVIVLIAAGVVGFLMIKDYTDPSNKVIRALNDGDIDAAIDAFEDVESVDAELIDGLKAHIEKLYASLKDNSMTYEAVVHELEAIENMGISELKENIESTKKAVEALNDSRAFYATAVEFQNKGNYDEAIKEYRKVIKEDGNYQTAQTNIDTCSDLFRKETIAKAEEYATSGDYENALTVLNAALDILENDAEIKKQISVYTAEHKDHLVAQTIKSAEEAVNNGDYPEAIGVLEELLETIDSSEAEQKLNRYKADYEAECIEKIDALIADKKFDDAEKFTKDALKVLPDNEALNNKLTEIEDKRPVSLSSLTPIIGGWTWNEGTPTDPFGVTYTNASNFVIFYDYENNTEGLDEYKAEYRLYGEYETLTGEFISHSDISENGVAKVQIYADDMLVYTSPEIGRKTDLTDFSVNISGADYVKIVVSVEKNYGSSDRGNTFILMNCLLWAE